MNELDNNTVPNEDVDLAEVVRSTRDSSDEELKILSRLASPWTALKGRRSQRLKKKNGRRSRAPEAKLRSNEVVAERKPKEEQKADKDMLKGLDRVADGLEGFWQDEKGKVRRENGAFANKEETKAFASAKEEREKREEEKNNGILAKVVSTAGGAVSLAAKVGGAAASESDATDAAGVSAGGSYFYAAKEIKKLSQDITDSTKGTIDAVKGIDLGKPFRKLGGLFGGKDKEVEKNSTTQSTEVVNATQKIESSTTKQKTESTSDTHRSDRESNSVSAMQKAETVSTNQKSESTETAQKSELASTTESISGTQEIQHVSANQKAETVSSEQKIESVSTEKSPTPAADNTKKPTASQLRKDPIKAAGKMMGISVAGKSAQDGDRKGLKADGATPVVDKKAVAVSVDVAGRVDGAASNITDAIKSSGESAIERSKRASLNAEQLESLREQSTAQKQNNDALLAKLDDIETAVKALGDDGSMMDSLRDFADFKDFMGGKDKKGRKSKKAKGYKSGSSAKSIAAEQSKKPKTGVKNSPSKSVLNNGADKVSRNKSFGSQYKNAGNLSKGAGMLTKLAAPLAFIGAGLDKWSEVSEREDLSTKQKAVQTGATAIGGGGGALAGAAAGAAIGSVVPVIGTAIGGLIGSVAGGMAGTELGDMVGEKISDWVGEGLSVSDIDLSVLNPMNWFNSDDKESSGGMFSWLGFGDKPKDSKAADGKNAEIKGPNAPESQKPESRATEGKTEPTGILSKVSGFFGFGGDEKKTQPTTDVNKPKSYLNMTDEEIDQHYTNPRARQWIKQRRSRDAKKEAERAREENGYTQASSVMATDESKESTSVIANASNTVTSNQKVSDIAERKEMRKELEAAKSSSPQAGMGVVRLDDQSIKALNAVNAKNETKTTNNTNYMSGSLGGSYIPTDFRDSSLRRQALDQE